MSEPLTPPPPTPPDPTPTPVAAPPSAPSAPGAPERRHTWVEGRGLRHFIVRLHSLAILLLLAWAGYVAVVYLIHSVFWRTPVPAKYVDWPGHLEAAALRGHETTGQVSAETPGHIPGVNAAAARAPIGHYHKVERWFQDDPHNGCTSAGCHNPLPHTKHVESRAFANFHTTFLACTMCHTPGIAPGTAPGTAPGSSSTEGAARPLAAAWLTTATGQRQDPPAILSLMRYYETQGAQIKAAPQAAHPILVAGLHALLPALGGDPVLDDLLVQIETSEPGSPVWRHAVDRVALELPAHVRGEYGAKLAPAPAPAPAPGGATTGGDARQSFAALSRQTRAYLAAPAGDAGKAQRDQISKAIHAGLPAKPTKCTACHADQPALLDFEALGYSAKHARFLHDLPVARMMQQLRDGGGQPFYLPRILEGGQ